MGEASYILQRPQMFYKYREWYYKDDNGKITYNKFTKEILEDNLIYFSSCSQFNDPYDGDLPMRFDEKTYTSEKIKRVFNQFAVEALPNATRAERRKAASQKAKERKGKNFIPPELREYLISDMSRHANTFGLYSMTKNKNNLLMWSHYADSLKGICIGFKMNNAFLDRNILTFWKIKYAKEIPFTDFETEYIEPLLTTKAKCWNYEKEFRLVAPERPKKKISFENYNLIKEIIIGYRMDEDVKQDLIQWIKENLKGCKIYEAIKNKDSFKLDIIPIQ